jgi:cytochrome c biogenesis protein CcmG, thiol:disulfide interchange protein DsbE
MLARFRAAALATLVFAPVTTTAAPAAPGFRVVVLDVRREFDSRDHIGKKIVVLRFQASWCRPCAKESAALGRLADHYRGRDVEFLALQVQDTLADARRFVETQRPSYLVALDPTLTIGNRYGVKGTPYTVVIDRKGEVVARLAGESAPTRLPKILDELLAPKPRGR